MLGVIIAASILFVIFVVIYNLSAHPEIFKSKNNGKQPKIKKEKKLKEKVVKEKVVDPDLKPRDISLKKSKKSKNKSETDEVVNIEPVNTFKEEIVEDNIDENFDENFDESIYKPDENDDLFFGLEDEDEENEVLEDLRNLSPKMKAILLTDIFKRKDW